MSLLGAFVRDVVEPVALSILQWAWTFDPAHTYSCFHVAVPILRLLGNEHTPLALRTSASLAASYTLDFRHV